MRLLTPAWLEEKVAREKAMVAAAKRQGARASSPEDAFSSKPAARLKIVK
jgi:hypothetical protein